MKTQNFCLGATAVLAGAFASRAYNEWVNIDATWVDDGRYEYIGLTDDEIAETHTADLSYPDLVARETTQETSKSEPIV